MKFFPFKAGFCFTTGFNELDNLIHYVQILTILKNSTFIAYTLLINVQVIGRGRWGGRGGLETQIV